MAHNYLERLVAEWYEYQRYFVRRNILVGMRDKGGHACELDVVVEIGMQIGPICLSGFSRGA